LPYSPLRAVSPSAVITIRSNNVITMNIKIVHELATFEDDVVIVTVVANESVVQAQGRFFQIAVAIMKFAGTFGIAHSHAVVSGSARTLFIFIITKLEQVGFNGGRIATSSFEFIVIVSCPNTSLEVVSVSRNSPMRLFRLLVSSSHKLCRA
jgi:hypothetical protein